MSTASSESSDNKPRNILILLPLIAFLALAALFFYRLGTGDPSRIPSALIGRPVPPTDLPPLPGLERAGKAIPGINNATFQGAVTLVNVWASWCVPCHDEVPFLNQLSKDKRIQLVGESITRMRQITRDVSSTATAILFPRPGGTKLAARRSIGVSMAYRKHS